MVRMIQLGFALIAYVCVATVIALAGGIGYLWSTDRLNDDKLFRMMALLHDVELQQVSATSARKENEVPPEEPSMDDVVHHRQIQDRNYEVRLLALQRGRQEYDHRLQQLKEQTDRYDRLAQEWQNKVKQQEELTTQENLANVVNHFEQIKPEQSKALLLMRIDEGRMDDAILLMSKMSDSKLKKVLQQFVLPDELAKLHAIHNRIIAGTPGTEQLQKTLQNLDSSATAPATSSSSGANP